MNAEIKELSIGDSFLVKSSPIIDDRGGFVKTFNDVFYKEFILDIEVREQYYTYSSMGVLRGMHFQVPPADHDKIVYCIDGEVLDVILDLRKGSSSYGHCESINLRGRSGDILIIPKGVAHGFLTLSTEAVMLYNVSSVYDSKNDCGILWSSFGFNWPILNPILSERDKNHPSFLDFENPF